MKKNFLLLLLSLFVSCSQKKEKSSDFYDKILDLIIENSNGESVEFPQLYNKLTNRIEDDNNEKVKLVEKLKSKGFKITNWGRGNHALGPRIVIINLKKDNCECEVAKKYYSTTNDTLYNITEQINCNIKNK